MTKCFLSTEYASYQCRIEINQDFQALIMVMACADMVT